MKFKNIVAKRTYKTADGTEKVNWLPVGTLKEHEGKQFIELNFNPGVSYYVFEPKPKKIGTEPMNPEDIAF